MVPTIVKAAVEQLEVFVELHSPVVESAQTHPRGVRGER
jgi:hypothetical protein